MDWPEGAASLQPRAWKSENTPSSCQRPNVIWAVTVIKETLSKGARLREGWEGESGFQASGVNISGREPQAAFYHPRGREEPVTGTQALDKSQWAAWLPLLGISWETCWMVLTPDLGLGSSGMAFLIRALLDLARMGSRGGPGANRTEQSRGMWMPSSGVTSVKIAVPFLLSYLVTTSAPFPGTGSIQKGRRGWREGTGVEPGAWG